MELKMVQDMYSIYQNHFLLLFLDISKAYDMLDRGRFLQTLERYGARKKLCGILVDFGRTNMWSQGIADPMSLRSG